MERNSIMKKNIQVCNLNFADVGIDETPKNESYGNPESAKQYIQRNIFGMKSRNLTYYYKRDQLGKSVAYTVKMKL